MTQRSLWDFLEEGGSKEEYLEHVDKERSRRVKPLLYAEVPGGFLFASEAKGILAHPSFRAELDEEAFHHYLTFAFAQGQG